MANFVPTTSVTSTQAIAYEQCNIFAKTSLPLSGEDRDRLFLDWIKNLLVVRHPKGADTWSYLNLCRDGLNRLLSRLVSSGALDAFKRHA